MRLLSLLLIGSDGNLPFFTLAIYHWANIWFPSNKRFNKLNFSLFFTETSIKPIILRTNSKLADCLRKFSFDK